MPASEAYETREGVATPEPAPTRPSILSALLGFFKRPKHTDASDAEVEAGDDAPAAADAVRSGPLLANARDFNPLPAERSSAATSSEEIFAEIGRRLKARRLMLSLTLEEIERHTRIRLAFLKALEEGALEDLPVPVQTRGILANYAAFIDLDADAILLRFADGLQARHRENKPLWQSPRTRAPMTVHTSLPPLRSFIASDLLFGGGVAIMLILFSIWGINRIMALRSASPARGSSPSIPEILAGTVLPTLPQLVTLIPAQDTPLALTPVPSATSGAELATLPPDVSVQVQLDASERTYMRITVDGTPEFEGRAEPGQDYTYQAAKQIEVVVGNGAALRVTHNGHKLGLMGSFGEVVDRLYTAQGVLTPTSTPAPTRTATATSTATPSLIPTVPTFTPTPKVEH